MRIARTSSTLSPLTIDISITCEIAGHMHVYRLSLASLGYGNVCFDSLYYAICAVFG
jgi:hypothetical protein